MTNPSDDELERGISGNETRSKVCAWAVVAGLVIETVLAAVYGSHASLIENWAPVFADALIALGVFGEIFFSGRVSEAEEKLRLGLKKKVARLTEPRVLTQAQRARIVEKLKKFPGIEYDITINLFEPEILDFVLLVELVLSTAEWTELDWQGDGEKLIREGAPLIRLGASVVNVVIGVHVNLWECAQALSDALIAEDIDATARRFIPHATSSTNANAIHIFIGRKI